MGDCTGHRLSVQVPYRVVLELAKEYVWAIRDQVPGPRRGGPPLVVTRTQPVLLPWRERRDMAKRSGSFIPHPNLLDVHIHHRSTPQAPDRYGAQLQQEELL